MSSAAAVVQATGKHSATLIFLHGLGDTGHGWAQSLQAYKPPNTKLICPHAGIIPVTLNGGMRMPSWFDLRSLDPNGSEDADGIKAASLKVRAMIEQEIKDGIPVERIVLGGFSQGGALAIYTGLTFPGGTLGGIVALSAWLPLHKQFPYGGDSMKKPPILQCHGQADPLVTYSFGLLTSQLLQPQFTGKYTFKSYPGLMHSSSDQELRDVRDFLKKVLP